VIKELTEKKWDQFFELMADILNMDGTWADKADVVRGEAEARDQATTLDEFAGWFARPDE
jgi:hypothetical protein